MIFSDEHYLWAADLERMASKLANKSATEIEDILFESKNYRVCYLRVTQRCSVGVAGRLLLPLAFAFFVVLASVKWFLTGGWYLDSWKKKYSWIRKISDFTGVM